MKVSTKANPQAVMNGAGTGKAPTTSLERQMQRVRGARAVEELVAGFSTTPVVLIAGQQCTGKGTVAPLVGKALAGDGARIKGTGKLMREAAQQAGKDVETFVKSVPPDFDVELDFRAAKLVAEGGVDVFESRLAGHLGRMLQARGRENLVSVYLTASPREQALRYLQREVGPDARQRVERSVIIPKTATLEQALTLAAAADPAVKAKIGPLIDEVGARDEVDRKRLLSLYGVDYQDPSAFDVVVSTDGKTPQQVTAEVIAAVRARA
ncbi:MAG: hypothetical protein A2138_07435 [Deltaproteobacteria bacterium RBG_16_71_12]|nr:MAG: hypothetical protein A2138_07435 [Deltaproteobacteria bacterium RBG_16_71_12]